jgi:hypothetical protein
MVAKLGPTRLMKTYAFPGMRIQDERGKKLADVRVEVSRRGIRLEGKKGVLGNFPFQSIISWTRSAPTALGLVVVANGGQRQIVLHSEAGGVKGVVVLGVRV